MLLYHASTTIVAKPRIFRGEIGRDFGFGFYVTPERALAERWAWQRAEILAAQTGGLTKAIINVYRWPGPGALRVKELTQRDQDWLQLVTTGRGQMHTAHDFDLVSGPSSTGDAGAIVNLVVGGFLAGAEAEALLAKIEDSARQLALCTPAAIASLQYQNSVELRERPELTGDKDRSPFFLAERAGLWDYLDGAVSKLISAERSEQESDARKLWQQSKTYTCLHDDHYELTSQSPLAIFQLLEEEQDYQRQLAAKKG